MTAFPSEYFDKHMTLTRAAAHVTTSDTPGLMPTFFADPHWDGLVNTPLLDALDLQQYGPSVGVADLSTFNAKAAAQAAEKGQLATGKMLFGRVNVNEATVGFASNISQQSADWAFKSTEEAQRIAVLNGVEAWFTDQIQTAANTAADIPTAIGAFDATSYVPTLVMVELARLVTTANELDSLTRGGWLRLVPVNSNGFGVVFTNPGALYTAIGEPTTMRKTQPDLLGTEVSHGVPVAFATRDGRALQRVP